MSSLAADLPRILHILFERTRTEVRTRPSGAFRVGIEVSKDGIGVSVVCVERIIYILSKLEIAGKGTSLIPFVTPAPRVNESCFQGVLTQEPWSDCRSR